MYRRIMLVMMKWRATTSANTESKISGDNYRDKIDMYSMPHKRSNLSRVKQPEF